MEPLKVPQKVHIRFKITLKSHFGTFLGLCNPLLLNLRLEFLFGKGSLKVKNAGYNICCKCPFTNLRMCRKSARLTLWSTMISYIFFFKNKVWLWGYLEFYVAKFCTVLYTAYRLYKKLCSHLFYSQLPHDHNAIKWRT